MLADLRGRHPAVRWTRVDQYHATLVFLGSTDPAAVPDAVAALAGVAARRSPFEALTGEAGGFAASRRGGGVAWLRLAAGHDALAEIALELDTALGSGIYGSAAPPRPHVTLARRVDGALLDDLRAASPALATRWPVERLVLYRSHTVSAGSRYEELSTFPLGAP